MQGSGVVVTEPAAQEGFAASYPETLFTDQERLLVPVLARSTAPYRQLIVIGAGSDQGVVDGATVVLPDGEPGGSFVGRVVKVSSDTSEVETLFEPSWKSAVRVGTSSIDALLVGGLTPTLTRLSKGASVGAGDLIINSDDSLPYGLFMGRLTELRDAADGVLVEGVVALPYDLTTLRFVEVLQ